MERKFLVRREESPNQILMAQILLSPLVVRIDREVSCSIFIQRMADYGQLYSCGSDAPS